MKFQDFVELQEQYIGSCVDVGYGRGVISDIYSDATEMAQDVYDPNEDDLMNSKEITKEDFYKNFSEDSIPKKALDKTNRYFYVGYSLKLDQAKLFYIYNEKQDIHYFFKRGRT